MITITPEAIELILKKSRNVTVLVKEVASWCGVDRFPVVYRGKPGADSQERFEQYPVNGVTIWKSKDIHSDPNGSEIQITIKRLFWFRRLDVQGVAM